MPPERVLFIALTAFSQTGGIEKFNRAFGRGLQILSEEGKADGAMHVLYDDMPDERYIVRQRFRGFRKKKTRFILSQIRSAASYHLIFLGHLNLAVIGYLLKKLYPRKKLVLICHGIEVFSPLNGIRRKMLQQADHILAVSSFTKDKLVRMHGVREEKITIFPNSLDPFFDVPKIIQKPAYLLERYRIDPGARILFTLSRQSSAEQYKGYDDVLRVLPEIKKRFPSIRYIIGGRADAIEKNRIEMLVKENGLIDTVIFPGFIPAKELTDHYLLSDLFIMPSKGEGFGIVFIEAMACGLPVVAGNKDGSADALLQGKLGTLVDPDDPIAIENAVIENLEHSADGNRLREQVLDVYGFDKFCKRLLKAMQAVSV